MTDQIPLKAIKTGSTATALGEFASGDQIPGAYLQSALDQSAFKNLLINGDFSINQRAFVGGALAAGVYGFDRWKAGSGGCNVSLSAGTLTHTSGPLVQVIEAPSLAGKAVTVSVEDPSGSITVGIDGVTGTITAGAGRRGASLTVPSGSTGNVTLTLTATGVTYKRVQLEIGSIATAWDQRHAAMELMICHRYFEAGTNRFRGLDSGSSAVIWNVSYAGQKRAIPALSGGAVTIGGSLNTVNAFSMQLVGSGTVDTGIVAWKADAEL